MTRITLWVLPAFGLLIFLSMINCTYELSNLYDQMKCSYGERGSLTATCVNATPGFFKFTLYKFDHLDETLRCLNCTLKTIESNTFDLSGNQIKVLDISNSSIEVLKPKAFMGLVFLQALYLNNNKIRSIFPGTFIGTKKIAELNLENNEIAILSESGFAELVQLTDLNLRRNSIIIINVHAFIGLKSLEMLDLSYNLISMVNQSMENLTSLEMVSLKHNAIEELSGREFSSLANLYQLDLSENRLADKFAIIMHPNNQLRNVYLAHNKIRNLSFEMSRLEALEDLDLSFNNISEIRNGPFADMFSLRKLDLTFNNLTQFKTGWFSSLPQLISLNCSHNRIQEIVISNIFPLRNLHFLDLSSNLLYEFEYTALISRLPGLVYLRLEDNPLPCSLMEDMEAEFENDNFKFTLAESEFKTRICHLSVSLGTKSSAMRDTCNSNQSDSVRGVDIFIFIVFSLVIAAIAILFYLQFLIYRGVELSSPKRVASTVQLITSEEDQKEDEFDNDRA